MEQDLQVYFGIKEIKETAFFADESINFDAATKSSFQYNVNFLTDTGDESVTFHIEAIFKELENDRPFLSGKSLTRFTIKDLKKYQASNSAGFETVSLPNPVWITLFSLSYSHARALLARSAAGTKFSSLLIPLINPEDAFNNLVAAGFGKTAPNKTAH